MSLLMSVHNEPLPTQPLTLGGEPDGNHPEFS
jgi:hypothetical protein